MDDLASGAGRGSLADAPAVDHDLVDTAPLAYDLLTGLVSREVFDGQLARVLERTWRTPTSVAVLVLQIRDLRLINDRFGHMVGDEVLGAAAARLRSCLREVDLVARIDTATFGVILETDRRQARPELMAADVSSRLVSLFAEPLSTTLTDLAVQAAIGVAVADRASLHADHLVGRAELAMAGAIQAGEGFKFYEAGHQADAVRRLQLKTALGRAIEREALSLRYQPLVSLRTGATVGVEALLRWDDAEHGSVSPSEFIPVAEETDLIIPIGEWVLQTALEQRAAWVQELPGLPVIGLSVNVSARQMARPGLVDAVRRNLDGTGLAPEVLLLELTESALMADDEVVRAQIKGLRDLGVRLGLDDFGTGWSSLEYLNRLSVDVLKIAQVFVDQIGTSTRATALVRAIIDLAHSLGLITVAEGVETEEQADRLRQMGCFLGQGWHFGRELTVDDATDELRRVAHPGLAGGAT
jgi:diguanylate cyclase (GGDEF)-like protein